MTSIQEAERLLSKMSQAEKLKLLQLLARDLSDTIPGIVQTPGVLGGKARIVGTRIPVWALVQYRKLGATESELLQAYPSLRAEDLRNAWSYFQLHREEIEQQIIENETA